MALDFNQARWEKVKCDNRKWWTGELNRPLIQVRLKGREPKRPKPALPYHLFTSFYEDHVTAEQITDVWDYELCRTEFLGDAFPEVLPYFGAGVLAAYLGAELKNGNDTVWFHPKKDMDIKTLDFEYFRNNKWFRRTTDIIASAIKRWQGLVQIGLTDLGGTLDILSSFRPAEKLLYDLYDAPDDVKRLTWKTSKMWWRYFSQIDELIKPCNPGYTDWARIFSEQTYCMLQCDFCYMLGPSMFEEFVKPELKAVADKLDHAFYHLDGPGQLAHLDSILEIDSIKGIQWIPGEGQPDTTHWPQVYKKITLAGKKIHLMSSLCENPLEILDIVGNQTGTINNIIFHLDGDISKRCEVEKILNKYNFS